MQPRRDDDVAKWLRRKREEQDDFGWDVLDGVLDEYRLRADYGRSLTDSLDGLEDGCPRCRPRRPRAGLH